MIIVYINWLLTPVPKRDLFRSVQNSIKDDMYLFGAHRYREPPMQFLLSADV